MIKEALWDQRFVLQRIPTIAPAWTSPAMNQTKTID